MVLCVQTTSTAMPETTQETCAPAKDSPFFIKNLLNCDSKPSKPKPVFAATKAALEAGFSLSPVGDLPCFPRFDLSAQRFTLPAQYLERTSAWWYPYTLGSTAHLHRTEGKWWRFILIIQTRFLKAQFRQFNAKISVSKCCCCCYCCAHLGVFWGG